MNPSHPAQPSASRSQTRTIRAVLEQTSASRRYPLTRFVFAGQYRTAGCAPLPMTYYMPSAEHATIEQYSCDQAPPHEAILVTGILKASAFFDGRRIEIGFYPIGFYPSRRATIEIQTALIQIEANGQFLGPFGYTVSRVRLQSYECPKCRRLDLNEMSRRLGASRPIPGSPGAGKAAHERSFVALW
jgi:hypothetical protein